MIVVVTICKLIKSKRGFMQGSGELSSAKSFDGHFVFDCPVATATRKYL